MSLKSVQPLKLVASGSVALNNATPVDVAVLGIEATDIIVHRITALAGATPGVYSVVIGDNEFTLTAGAGNTSTVEWAVLRKCD